MPYGGLDQFLIGEGFLLLCGTATFVAAFRWADLSVLPDRQRLRMARLRRISPVLLALAVFSMTIGASAGLPNT